MQSRNKLKTIAIATSIALLGMSSVAHADIGSKMNSMFNSLSNTTAPGAFETSARGVVSGGSLVIRNQISSVNLFNVQAPSLSMGCGGIDFFGGSFSFISADQLVEFLKNVASNALGYAFKMALKSTCESCLVILNDLQNLAQAINGLNFNSCELASGIFSGSTDKMFARQTRALTDIWAAGEGLVEDVANAWNGTTGQTGTQAAKNDSTNTVRDKIHINFAYKAAKDAGSSSMFSDGDSDRTSLEFLISLTGTVVQEFPATTASDDAMPAPSPYPATISFKDFVEGTYGAGENGDNRSVSIYKCDEADKCLKPTAKPSGAFKGLRKLIVEKLTTPGAVTNLPHLFRNNEGKDLTAEQKNVAKFIGPVVTKHIRDLSLVDEGMATQYIIDTAPIIAAQVAFENGVRIFQQAETSFRSLDTNLEPKPAKDEMAKAYQRFVEGYNDYIQTHGGLDKLIEYRNLLMQDAQTARALRNNETLGKK